MTAPPNLTATPTLTATPPEPGAADASALAADDQIPLPDAGDVVRAARPEKSMQVVVRALRTLTALAENPSGLSQAALHDLLAIPTGSMHRVLATLVAEAFVTRSPLSRVFVLGPAARQLGATGQPRSRLVPTSALLTQAAERTGETVFLTELIGADAVCVSLAESIHPLRLFVHIGQSMPLNAAASARVILAFQDDAVARDILRARPLTVYTGATPTSEEDLTAHFEAIRQRGYDVCDSELDSHVWAVAAPVFDADNSVRYSLALAAAEGRVADPVAKARAIETVLSTARALSETQGFVWRSATSRSAPSYPT
jgi:IclR family acetate operon transcriptional repressor